MKKFLVFLTMIMSVMALIGCGSTPAQNSAASGADEIDMSIREASDYLNERIPLDSKVVFLNVRSDYPNLSEYILNDLSMNAVNDGSFSVVDRQQLDAIRAELNFQYSGEVSDSSAQEVGAMLGAQSIVSGSVSKIGDLYRLDIKVIEVESAEIQGQWRRNIPNGATIAALAETVGGAGSSSSSGTAAKPVVPAGPKNGTYTFYPRLQATQAGVPVRAYIDKVIVSDGYVNIYACADPVGVKGNIWNMYGKWTFSVTMLLQDLDTPSRRYTQVKKTQNDNEGGVIITFEKVTGTRFSFSTEDNPAVTFSEIILGEPDVE